MGPGDLHALLAAVRLPPDPQEVLVGARARDDAGVYRLSEELALVQSVDYFTPIVDDPYTFGAIAAANALSDLYAMGARPLVALNVAGFPPKGIPAEQLAVILQGAVDKLQEAGAVLLGGHTVEDRELKFGLAVTGLADPRHLFTRSGARPGDQLVLTKPIGGGVVATALKAGQAASEDIAAMADVMCRLNDLVDPLRACGVRACTDVTGFGLLGHALEMARQSRVGLRLFADRVPLLQHARQLAAAGHVPGGTRHNMEWVAPHVSFDAGVDPLTRLVLCDAMTSGGLLAAVPGERAADLLERLRPRRPPALALVGEVLPGPPGHVHVSTGAGGAGTL